MLVNMSIDCGNRYLEHLLKELHSFVSRMFKVLTEMIYNYNSPLVIVKLRANRQKTKDKLGPEIGFVMAWPTHPRHHRTFFEL